MREDDCGCEEPCTCPECRPGPGIDWDAKHYRADFYRTTRARLLAVEDRQR